MKEQICPLCKGLECELIDATIRNDNEKKYKMYKCKDCETHFINPLPTANDLENYYDGYFRKEVHTEIYYDNEYLKSIFQSFLPEAKLRVQRVEKDLCLSDRILEIGCSVGYFLYSIQNKVSLAYGTEWDSKSRMFIKDEFKSKIIKTSKNPEDFNLIFDKIFMFHVLEHIEDPINYLKSLKKYLQPDGKIYIEVPNVDDVLIKTYACKDFINFYYKKAHLYNFNEKGLGFIFDHAGFEYQIEYIQRYDISNHFYWLANRKPGGQKAYSNILSEEANKAYINSLIAGKQTDTLFAIISPKK